MAGFACLLWLVAVTSNLISAGGHSSLHHLAPAPANLEQSEPGARSQEIQVSCQEGEILLGAVMEFNLILTLSQLTLLNSDIFLYNTLHITYFMSPDRYFVAS